MYYLSCGGCRSLPIQKEMWIRWKINSGCGDHKAKVGLDAFRSLGAWRKTGRHKALTVGKVDMAHKNWRSRKFHLRFRILGASFPFGCRLWFGSRTILQNHGPRAWKKHLCCTGAAGFGSNVRSLHSPVTSLFWKDGYVRQSMKTRHLQTK